MISKRTCIAVLLATGFATCLSAQDKPSAGDEAEVKPPPALDIELTPSWNDLTANGNSSGMFQYSSIPDQFFGDVAGVVRDQNTRTLLFHGWWRGLGSERQSGFVELRPGEVGSYMRFWANRFEYYIDPTVGLTQGSLTNDKRFKSLLTGGIGGAHLTFNVNDRSVRQPDIVRLRPGPAYDYRTLSYDSQLVLPYRRGDFRISLNSVGFDDRTGYMPTGNSRDFGMAVSHAVTDRIGATASFNNVKVDQNGLGTATMRSWRAGASWLLAPRLTWRASGELNRYDLPFTLGRYASNKDRFGTDLNWRATHDLGIQLGFTRRSIERVESGDPVTQRPASNEFLAKLHWHPESIGNVGVRFKSYNLLEAPAASVPFLSSADTLYYDRVSRLDAHWNRMFGDVTNVYAGYQWTKRENTEREFELRSKSLNVGLNTMLAHRVGLFLDYLWDDWDSNGSDTDSTGLNTGSDGPNEDGTFNRLLFSEGRIVTVGVNYMFNNDTWLDLTASSYIGRGGLENDTKFFSIDLRRKLIDGFSIGVGYQRQEFNDDLDGRNNYDNNLFRVFLSGSFGTR